MYPRSYRKQWADSATTCNIEKLIMLLAALISLVFTLAGTADTNLYTQYVPAVGRNRLSIWSFRHCPLLLDGCSRVSAPPAWWCNQKKSLFRAMQAFSILSVLLCALWLLATILKSLVTRTGARQVDCLFVITLVVAWVFVLIEWAIAAGTFHIHTCGASSLANLQYQYSASFALFLITWLIQTLVLVYFIALRCCC